MVTIKLMMSLVFNPDAFFSVISADSRHTPGNSSALIQRRDGLKRGSRAYGENLALCKDLLHAGTRLYIKKNLFVFIFRKKAAVMGNVAMLN